MRGARTGIAAANSILLMLSVAVLSACGGSRPSPVPSAPSFTASTGSPTAATATAAPMVTPPSGGPSTSGPSPSLGLPTLGVVFPSGWVVVFIDDHTSPTGTIRVDARVKADARLDIAFACAGTATMTLTLIDAEARSSADPLATPSPLFSGDVACATGIQHVSATGGTAATSVNLEVTAAEGARWWALIAVPADDVAD
jgi:hypothetical protein